MSTRKTTLFYAVLLAIASVAIGMVLASRLDLSPTSSAQPLTSAPPANSAPITGAIDATTFRTIAREVSPAVVNIRTESTPRTEELTDFFGGDDFLRRFLPEGQQPGQGSRQRRNRPQPQSQRGRQERLGDPPPPRQRLVRDSGHCRPVGNRMNPLQCA